MLDENYVIIHTVKYDDAKKFYKPYLSDINIVTIVYYVTILISVAGIVVSDFLSFSFEGLMTDIGYVLFMLLPYAVLHEGLHLVGYFMVGGRRVGLSFHKGIINSTCERSITKNSVYMLPALLPVAVITATCICIYILFDGARGCISMMCMVQLLGSKWDVATASYCYRNPRQFFCEEKVAQVMYYMEKSY